MRLTRAEWRRLRKEDRNRPGRGEAALVYRDGVAEQVTFVCGHGTLEKVRCLECEKDCCMDCAVDGEATH